MTGPVSAALRIFGTQEVGGMGNYSEMYEARAAATGKPVVEVCEEVVSIRLSNVFVLIAGPLLDVLLNKRGRGQSCWNTTLVRLRVVPTTGPFTSLREVCVRFLTVVQRPLFPKAC
jgi:hypothetical protein